MDIKKEFNEFFQELSSTLGEHGFIVSKNEADAMKKIDVGFCELFFDIHKVLDYSYTIDIKIFIRCDAIQEVRGKITTQYAEEDSVTVLSTPYTLMLFFEKPELDFEKKGGRIINFDNKASKEKWFLGFNKFMNEIGFSFFERFTTTEDFHQWFNDPILNNNPGFEKGLNWHNSVCGLIAAKLVNSADYEKIYTIRINHLIAKQNKQAIEELQKTKLYLDEHY